MKSARDFGGLACVALGLVMGVSQSAFVDDLVLDSSLTISTVTTYNIVATRNGSNLTADGVITVPGELIIQSGGVLAHSLRDTSGLDLDVMGALDPQSGGLIDLSTEKRKASHA